MYAIFHFQKFDYKHHIKFDQTVNQQKIKKSNQIETLVVLLTFKV